ncbi:MAG: ABC transporter permease subunit [Bacillota bacterium]|nr:ABC transporter permease subunit [Bacillota bacterium]
MKKSKAINLLDLLVSLSLGALVIIFILLPFLSVFKESFFVDGNFDLGYYREIFARKTLIANTFKMGILTTLLAALSSSCVAIFYFFAGRKTKAFIIAILSITLISPPFVSSLSYISLFGRRGLITYRLLGLNLYPYGMWGVVLMQVLSDLSLNSLLLIGFLQGLDRNVLNSARSLGAKTDNIIVDLIFPAMKNSLIAVMLLSFFRSISDFGTPAIIGGRFTVLSLESYFEVIANGNLAKAAAMNVVILLPTLLIFLIFSKDLSSTNMAQYKRGAREEVDLQRSGFFYYTISTLAIFFILWILSLYGSIILNAFTKMKKGNLVFTLDNFRETKFFIGDVVFRSIGYSLVSALGGSLLGLLIGYYLIIRKERFMKFIDLVANLPYIIPGTFFGLGYLLFFRSPPIAITGTSAIVILNVLFKQLPFSTRVQNAAMKDVDKNTLNSIRDLGGSYFNEVVDGVLPMTKNAIRVTMINAFTTTMTTVGTIIFLVYPGKKLLTLVMFDVIQSGKYNVGSVIAFYIILICLAFNILLRLLMGDLTFKKKYPRRENNVSAN